jgi:O-antigen biosynthesis protein WbqP
LVEARRRHGVSHLRPGITGVSQVAGVDMSDPERLAVLDATYLNQMGVTRDLQLIIRTVLGSGRGDRVGPA